MKNYKNLKCNKTMIKYIFKRTFHIFNMLIIMMKI
ncbi:hypothetical protein CUP1463 [Campylobacter upsaliensis RM3195]|nr:hypothetical protein CUP1463 [Campylobacter upsaliensis RM3195]